jgi:hypothetical protein
LLETIVVVKRGMILALEAEIVPVVPENDL